MTTRSFWCMSSANINLRSICAFNCHLTQFIGFFSFIKSIDLSSPKVKLQQFENTSSSSWRVALVTVREVLPKNSITWNYSIFTSFVILLIVLCDIFRGSYKKSLMMYPLQSSTANPTSNFAVPCSSWNVLCHVLTHFRNSRALRRQVKASDMMIQSVRAGAEGFGWKICLLN